MGLIRFLYNREFGKRGKACSQDFPARAICGQIRGAVLQPKTEPKALIVMTHGYNLCAEGYLPAAQHFADAGFAVLLFDGLGIGSSGGDAVRGMPQHVIDFVEVLQSVQDSPEWKDLPILLYGHSWGAYAADCAAAVSKAPIRGIVSASAFDDNLGILLPVVRHRYGSWIARHCENALRRIQQEEFGSYADLKASECLAELSCPLLILHAKDDRLVSFEEHFGAIKKALAEKANAQFLTPEEGNHDIGFTSSALFAQYIDFYNACLSAEDL